MIELKRLVDAHPIEMKKLRIENAVRLLLAAWMLLSAPAMPSTSVHAHHGGNVSHHHYHPEGQLPSAYLPTGLHDAESCIEPSETHTHFSFMLWGAKFELPIGNPSSATDPNPREFCGNDAIAVLVLPAHTQNLTKIPSIDSWGPPCLAPIWGSVACEANQPDWRCSGDLPQGALLCDRARHERTGVLLA
jgi:hypothetical protein